MEQPVNWAADVKVSMPRPLKESNPGLVDMDGFTMTANGLAHNLSHADWVRLSVPTLAPVRPVVNEVRYDAHLDSEPVSGS
jgi:hypothetical protein